MWNSRPQKIHLKPFWLFDSAPYFSVCPITPQLWHFGGLPWNILGGMSSSSFITFSLVLISLLLRVERSWSRVKLSGFSSKLVHILFPGSLKLRISQSWILIYFGFNFDHIQLNTISENHMHKVEGDGTSIESFAKIQVLSFYTDWQEPTRVLFHQGMWMISISYNFVRWSSSTEGTVKKDAPRAATPDVLYIQLLARF